MQSYEHNGQRNFCTVAFSGRRNGNGFQGLRAPLRSLLRPRMTKFMMRHLAQQLRNAAQAKNLFQLCSREQEASP